MNTSYVRRHLRSIAACAALLILLPLAACTTSPAPSGESTIAPDAGSTSTPAPDVSENAPASVGESSGCPSAVAEYSKSNGYPESASLDPSALEIPLIQFANAPDCYFVDESSGVVRHGAFWKSDPQAVLTSLGSALGGAGYRQSEDYGPLVWWAEGDDPTTAEHLVVAAVQQVDGVDFLWATW